MKGLVEDTDAGTIYLSIKHHAICHESKSEQAGHEAVVVENPRTKQKITKYIKKYKLIEAMVCKVEWYEREHEGTKYRGFKLSLNAAGTPCVLDIPLKSRICSRFMKLAENIDFTQPVEFSAWYDSKSDATAFNVKQGGESVPQKYTNDNPNGCPPPEDDGTGDLDWRKQTKFLLGRMKDVVIPAVEKAGNQMPQVEQAQAASAGASNVPVQPEPEDDDIPF